MALVIYDPAGGSSPATPAVEKDFYAKIRDGIAAGVQRYAAERPKERWITIHPHGHEEGTGTPVKVDDKGNIVGGPKGIADKGITKLSDFGKKDGESKDAKKPSGKYHVRGNEIWDDNGVRHAAARTEDRAQSIADEWNKSGKPGEKKEDAKPDYEKMADDLGKAGVEIVRGPDGKWTATRSGHDDKGSYEEHIGQSFDDYNAAVEAASKWGKKASTSQTDRPTHEQSQPLDQQSLASDIEKTKKQGVAYQSFADRWKAHKAEGHNDFNATLNALSDHLKSRGVDVSPSELNGSWSNHHVGNLSDRNSDDDIRNAFEKSRDLNRPHQDEWWMTQSPSALGAENQDRDLERRRQTLIKHAAGMDRDAEILSALGSPMADKMKDRANSIRSKVESNRKVFQRAIAAEKKAAADEESHAKEQRRWKEETPIVTSMTPKSLAKAYDNPRYGFAKMLQDTGWYSNSAMAVKPPEKMKQQILASSTIHDVRYPKIAEMAQEQSGNNNPPMRILGHRTYDGPVKRGKPSDVAETLLSDDDGDHVTVDSQYLQTIQKMHPKATFHAPMNSGGPIVVKDPSGDVVGLLMSKRSDDRDTDTENHVKTVTGARRVKRYSAGSVDGQLDTIQRRRDAIEQLTAAFSEFTQTFRALMDADPEWQAIGDDQGDNDDQEIINDDDADDDQNQSPLQQAIEQAASETDTDPTDAQKKAGNYAKGKFNLWGRTIAIESPRGSIRSGVAPDGEEWQNEMPHHYGYIKQTLSDADGDHIDCFIGPDPDSETVYVVNQNDDKGQFDEHKAMIGFDSEDEAREAYESAYPDDWSGLGSIVSMSKAKFLEWLDDGDTSTPVEPERDRYSRIARYVTMALSGT